ncbi:metabolite traffic protein EboE [Stieleria varia]|uniref:Xylose isomerase-like TIM barrel n=1 Tax=Stieleria varia TaxID=2528005 RepID=A0A5C5ZWN9_9BACT|nr:metabolite traffic protein EboE [Stieleria varia]TWT91570.1 Xylose isomerase-like TIM barrel [Stieleria varia]
MTNFLPKSHSTTQRPAREISYCTNVHAGTDLTAITANLDAYAVAVREKLAAPRLGVGLWIPDKASQELSGNNLSDFAAFLKQRRLRATTINGFPFDNFHGDVVKQQVYLPTWWDQRRLAYTQRLAEILRVILPSEQTVGSISTLPIGWPDNPMDTSSSPSEFEAMDLAGENFRRLATFLQKLEKESGHRIVVAIEPEPGCILDTTDDVITFFQSQLPDKSHRRYITVCHDICHAAVMMEDQPAVIEKYAQAGIGIGKVQVSSAIVVPWNQMSSDQQITAIGQLAEFAEDRYLHQTGCRDRDGKFNLVTDLPELLQRCRSDADFLADQDRWVIHFHVPIFLEHFGELATSRDDVLSCLQAIRSNASTLDFTGHLEVETYAWTVLPESMRQRGLAEDIASELSWLAEQLKQ